MKMIGTVFWWISFVDPDKPKGEKFLGACLVKALPENPHHALQAAFQHQCSPGGEAMFIEFPADIPMPDNVFQRYGNRLLSRAECEEFDAVMLAELDKASGGGQ